MSTHSFPPYPGSKAAVCHPLWGGRGDVGTGVRPKATPRPSYHQGLVPTLQSLLGTCQSPLVLRAAGRLEVGTGSSCRALWSECGLSVSGTLMQVGQGRDRPFLLQCGCSQLMREPSAWALLAAPPLLVHHELLPPPRPWCGRELSHYGHSAKVSLSGTCLHHDCGTRGDNFQISESWA